MSRSANRSGSDASAWISAASLSKTRARPVNRPSTMPPSTPASLMTAPPSGARLPRSSRSPPVGLNGAVSGWITSPSGAGGASRATCPASVSPVQVRQSPSRQPGVEQLA